jgi:uncharacterized protein (TIGR02001 family)
MRQISLYFSPKVRRTVSFLAVLAFCGNQATTYAWAAEQDIAPGEEYGPLATTPGIPFDIAFGISLTTDYVSRGITNNNSSPAIQGYIEPYIELPNLGTAYVNAWASNVDYGEGFEGAEIDVAAGIRPQFGQLSLDLGYVHYFYSPKHVSPDYGEIFAKADYNFDDKLTVGARVFFAPDYNQSGNTATWVAAGVRVPLPNDFSVYGGIGYQFFEDPDAFEQLAWTAGLSYNWKAVTLDLRYWGTDLSDNECVARSGFSDGCDSRVVATISFDTSFTEVKDWMTGK